MHFLKAPKTPMRHNIRSADLMALLSLGILSLIYFLYRVNDLTFISDEIYFFYDYFPSGERRRIFANFVQSFSDINTALTGVFLINFMMLIPLYFMLLKINHQNAFATFVQMIYLSALASYILRDILVLNLLIFAILIMLNFTKAKKKLLPLIILAAIGFLLLNLKPQYVFFLLASYSCAALASKTSGYVSVAILMCLIGLFLYTYGLEILTMLQLYSVSLTEFISMRADKYGYELDASGIIYTVIRHMFSPIPSSLLYRFMYPDPNHPLIVLDDGYRVLFRSCLYFCYLYIALNLKSALKCFEESRFFYTFLLMISSTNIVTYSLFIGGGGHERSKFLSALVFFSLASGIFALKRVKHSAFNIKYIRSNL